MRYPTQSRHIAEDRAVAQGGRGQFSRWIARHKEFREEYTLAHEFRAEDLAKEMVEIADDPSVLVETIAPQDVCAFEEPTTSMTGPCFFMPLNLIELNGDDLRRDPLEVRKATLASVVAKPRPACTSTSTLRLTAPTVFAHACKMGLEGIVSKRKDSLSLGALDALDQEQEPERTRSEEGSRGGLGPGLLDCLLLRKLSFTFWIRLPLSRQFLCFFDLRGTHRLRESISGFSAGFSMSHAMAACVSSCI